MNKERKSRVLPILLTVVLVLSQGAVAFADSDYFAGTEHGKLKFSEMKYQRPDDAAFNRLAAETKTLCAAAENAERVLENFAELEEQYTYFLTMDALATVYSCKDVTDTRYTEEASYLTALCGNAYDTMRDIAQTILASPCAKAAEAAWGAEYCEKVLAVRETTEAEIVLMAEAAELVNTYNRKSVEELYATVDGKPVDEAGLAELFAANAISKEVYDAAQIEIFQKKNQELGSIYLQLVAVNNRIAAAAGYDNYLDYQYKEAFMREYTPAEIRVLHAAVKETILPVFNKLNATADTGALDAYAAENLDLKTMQSLVAAHLGEIGGELTEAHEYMLKYELDDLEYSSNKMSMNFTMELPSYHSAYMFMQPSGNFFSAKSFIHEFGHFNQMYWVPMDPWPADVSYDVAEIHSQGLELLFLDYYDEMLGEQAPAAEAYMLKDSLASIIDGCMIDEIEQYAYTHPNITLEELNRTARTIGESYGTKFSNDSDYYYNWVQVMHMYQMPGYYISYAVSAISALQLWEEALADRPAAIEDYYTIVRMANDSYYDVLEAVDFAAPFEKKALTGLRAAIEKESGVLVDTYGHWSEDYADQLVLSGVIDGYAGSDGFSYFQPGRTVTRAELVKMLYGIWSDGAAQPAAAAARDFADVKADSWYAPAVQWAAGCGLVDGVGGGRFAPSAPVTRQDMAVILQRAQELFGEEPAAGTEAGNGADGFTDAAAISAYAQGAVADLKRQGVLTGRPDGSFAPKAAVTRADAAAALVKSAEAAAEAAAQ